MRSLSLVLLLVAVPAVTGAQNVGDSVRVKMVTTPGQLSGRLVALDAKGIRLRTFVGDTTVVRSNLARVDVYKRDNAALAVLAPTVLSGIVWGVSGTAKNDYAPFGTQPRNIVAGAGIGAVLGIIVYLLKPGSWHRVKLP